MAIVLISDSPLQENAALFENDAISGQDNGSIEWGEPFEVGSIWKVTLEGLDVEGTEIPSTTIEIDEEETVNPTKVFWWIVGAIKSTLCPECV
jgi:hypothetical protein